MVGKMMVIDAEEAQNQYSVEVSNPESTTKKLASPNMMEKINTMNNCAGELEPISTP